ncbi:MAG: DUF3108 domain-containing protein [Oligoflexales bacterium]
MRNCFTQFLFAFLCSLLFQQTASSECAKPLSPIMNTEEVYSGVPFKQGEVSTYEVHYAGILVGYGDILVLPPVYHDKGWLRVFEARTRTAEWYRAIFEAKDLARGWNRPQDFGVVKFKVQQDETSASISQLLQEKWLSFDHSQCEVKETIKKNENPLKRSAFELQPGAASSLGSVFKMRTMPLKIGTTERILVFSSGKNWWLEGKVKNRETITTPAGTYDTVKLKLQTYIGKDLQQKGEVYAWIADKHPNRPLVMMTGDIKLGRVKVTLHNFIASSKARPSIIAPTSPE